MGLYRASWSVKPAFLLDISAQRGSRCPGNPGRCSPVDAKYGASRQNPLLYPPARAARRLFRPQPGRCQPWRAGWVCSRPLSGPLTPSRGFAGSSAMPQPAAFCEDPPGVGSSARYSQGHASGISGLILRQVRSAVKRRRFFACLKSSFQFPATSHLTPPRQLLPSEPPCRR